MFPANMYLLPHSFEKVKLKVGSFLLPLLPRSGAVPWGNFKTTQQSGALSYWICNQISQFKKVLVVLKRLCFFSLLLLPITWAAYHSMSNGMQSGLSASATSPESTYILMHTRTHTNTHTKVMHAWKDTHAHINKQCIKTCIDADFSSLFLREFQCLDVISRCCTNTASALWLLQYILFQLTD